MESNANKCHLLISPNNTVNIRYNLCKKAGKKSSFTSKSNAIYEYLKKAFHYKRFFKITIQLFPSCMDVTQSC